MGGFAGEDWIGAIAPGWLFAAGRQDAPSSSASSPKLSTEMSGRKSAGAADGAVSGPHSTGRRTSAVRLARVHDQSEREDGQRGDEVFGPQPGKASGNIGPVSLNAAARDGQKPPVDIALVLIGREYGAVIVGVARSAQQTSAAYRPRSGGRASDRSNSLID